MLSRRRDASGNSQHAFASLTPHNPRPRPDSGSAVSPSFVMTTAAADPATKPVDPAAAIRLKLADEDDDPNASGVPGPAASQYLAARFARFRDGVNPHIVRTIMWIMLAGCSGLGVAASRGKERGYEFLTAYIVEYSLSVDNLFVFLLIFKYFNVPREAQETVLFWGIVGAMVLRGVMIVLGKALVERFEFVSFGFAALLIYSAVKLLIEDDDDDENLDDNRIVRFAKRLMPLSDTYTGERFFVRDGGRLLATPLFVVLVSIELSDVVFALDSVPAVLGISESSLVIYSSNILAVMGLRSLFFVISDAIKNLRFLRQSLAVVLGFIGIKMICGVFNYKLSILISLSVVAGTLSLGILLSVLFPLPEDEEEEAEDEEDPASPTVANGEVPPV